MITHRRGVCNESPARDNPCLRGHCHDVLLDDTPVDVVVDGGQQSLNLGRRHVLPDQFAENGDSVFHRFSAFCLIFRGLLPGAGGMNHVLVKRFLRGDGK